jgi:hypothetical protein
MSEDRLVASTTCERIQVRRRSSIGLGFVVPLTRRDALRSTKGMLQQVYLSIHGKKATTSRNDLTYICSTTAFSTRAILLKSRSFTDDFTRECKDTTGTKKTFSFQITPGIMQVKRVV